MKYLKGIAIVILLLVITYFVGPKPKKVQLDSTLPTISASIQNIDEFIAAKESKIAYIKPNNASRIIWADSVGKQTEYAIVYLHGFSASAMEGAPIHLDIAKKYGANLYLPRLYGHGVNDEDAFIDLRPEYLIESAKEALAIGKLIGKKVILMSCSTGGTLSLYLAANHPEIHSLIMYAPNVDLAAKGSNILVGPWGLQMARKMFNGKHREFEATEEMKKYWTNRYRLEGLINLKLLVNATMTDETFKAIHQPVFVGYYFKNEEEKDDIISIPRILEMYNTISTPEDQKEKVAFADAESHVINSSLTSKDLEAVQIATEKFCEEILKLVPITSELVN